MRGLATGNREGKPVEREQQIHTPEIILEVCENVWSHINLDPCASREYTCRAQHEYFDGGLELEWCDGVYVNPPYKHLKLWLTKSITEHDAGREEQILLFPVRTNRSWWCGYMDREHGPVTSAAWLKPLKFHGFKSAFPAPLVLVYTGQHVDDFNATVDAAGIADHIGDGI